jgi:hypothetical protein
MPFTYACYVAGEVTSEFFDIFAKQIGRIKLEGSRLDG